MKKKLFRGFSEIVRNDENAFLRLGWWVYNLLIIGLSCKKVLLVLNTQYSIYTQILKTTIWISKGILTIFITLGI